MDTRLRVMISSTIEDLGPEREVVDKAIRQLRFARYRAESMPTLCRPSREVCMQMAQRCDLFILILGQRYGYIIPDLGKSVTHYEYEIARLSDSTKVLVYVKKVPCREAKLEAFINSVTDFDFGYFRRPEFESADQLYDYLLEDIPVWVSERIMSTSRSSIISGETSKQQDLNLRQELLRSRRDYDIQYVKFSALVRSRSIDEIRDILPNIDVPRDVESALRAVLSEDWKARRKAISDLKHYNNPLVVSALCGVLDDPKPSIRKDAIRALGEIRKEEALVPLCLCLRDKVFTVRTAAAEALGKIGDTRAISFLLMALFDEYGSRIIKNRSGHSSEVLENQEFRKTIVKALVHFKEVAIPVLLESLEGKEDRVRWLAAEGLGKIGNEIAMQPLLHCLEAETTSEGKIKVITALAELNSKESASKVISYFNKNTEEDIKLCIIANMGRFFNNSNKQTVSLFLRQVLDTTHDLRDPVIDTVLKALDYCIHFRTTDIEDLYGRKRARHLVPLMPRLLEIYDGELQKSEESRPRFGRRRIDICRHVITYIARDSEMFTVGQDGRYPKDPINIVRTIVETTRIHDYSEI